MATPIGTWFAQITGRFLKSRGLRDAVYLFSSRSINSVLMMVFSLLAGKLLAVEDYGIYGQALARIVIVQAITEMGLQFSLVRFMAPAIRENDTRQTAAIFRASLHLKMIGFIFVGLLVSIFIGILSVFRYSEVSVPHSISTMVGFHPDFLFSVWMIFLGGAGMSMLSYMDAILVAHGKFKKLSFWVPAVGIFRLLLLGYFATGRDFAFRTEHVLFSYAVAPYMAMIPFFFFIQPSFFFQSSDRSDWMPWMGKLVGFNIWLVAASFMSIVSDWMEVLMILETHDAGLYNAARLPLQGFLIILSTMQSLILPRFSGQSEPGEIRKLFFRVYKGVVPLSVSLLPGFWIFAWFIPVWYGSDYSGSVLVFWLLYPNFLLRLYFAPLGTALISLDQPRLVAMEAGVRMVVGFFANLILIPTHGIIGAAIASFISQSGGWLFLVIVYLIYFKKGRFPWDGNPVTLNQEVLSNRAAQ